MRTTDTSLSCETTRDVPLRTPQVAWLATFLVAALLACAARVPETPRVYFLRQRGGPLFVGERVAIWAQLCTAPNRGCRSKPPVTFSIAGPDTTVARVLVPGIIEALTPGRAIVRMTAMNAPPESLEVTVLPPVRTLVLRPKEATIAVGDTVRLTATALDSAGMPVPGVWVQFSVDIPRLVPIAVVPQFGWPETLVLARQPGKYAVEARIFGHSALADSARLTVVRHRGSAAPK